MKKTKLIIAATAMTAVFLLSGCEGIDKISQPKIPDITENITLSGEISYEKLKASAELTRTDGKWQICYTSPESVNGLTVTIDGKNKNAALNGVKFDYNSEEVPFITVSDYICDSLDTVISKENISVASDNGKIKLTGASENTKSGFVICMNADGVIESISVGGAEMITVKE